MSMHEFNFSDANTSEYEVNGSVMRWLAQHNVSNRYVDLAIENLTSAPLETRRKFIDEYTLFLSDPTNDRLMQFPEHAAVVDIEEAISTLSLEDDTKYAKAWNSAINHEVTSPNYLLEDFDLVSYKVPEKRPIEKRHFTKRRLGRFGISWS